MESAGVAVTAGMNMQLRLTPPDGLEMSRPACQGEYRAKAKRRAGRVGSIELLGGVSS